MKIQHFTPVEQTKKRIMDAIQKMYSRLSD